MAKLSYEIMIQAADNGVIVRVGCKTLVFKDTDTDVFLTDLKALLAGDEHALRQKYYPQDMDAKINPGILNKLRPAYVGEECEPVCKDGR